MRFYQQQHAFYCGIDLHAKKLFVCVLDQQCPRRWEIIFALDNSPYGRSQTILSLESTCDSTI